MRLALLTDDWRPTGGVASYVRLVAPALAEAGHHVLVIHAGHADEDDSATPGLAVHAHTAALRDHGPRQNARATAAVITELESFQPDLVHVHANANHHLEATLISRWPTAKTVHGLDVCPSGTKFHAATDTTCTVDTGVMCLPRQVYLRCSLSKRPSVLWGAYRSTINANSLLLRHGHVIVASDYVRSLVARVGVAKERLSVAPYFTSAVTPAPPSTSRTVLYVGRINHDKGVDLLVEAMRRVSGDWRLRIVGDGIGMPALRSQIAATECAPRIELAGWLHGAALDQAYRDAAVVAVPSRWPEPFGIVGLEALARARPVVAFATGGIPEWLRDGEGGVLVPPRDVAAMARSISMLLDQPQVADTLARRGTMRVQQDFGVRAHLDRLLPVYDRLVSRD